MQLAMSPGQAIEGLENIDCTYVWWPSRVPGDCVDHRLWCKVRLAHLEKEILLAVVTDSCDSKIGHLGIGYHVLRLTEEKKLKDLHCIASHRITSTLLYRPFSQIQ